MKLIHAEGGIMMRFNVEVMQSLAPAGLLRRQEIEIIEKTHARRDMKNDTQFFAEIAAMKAFLCTVEQAQRERPDDRPF